MIVHGCLLGFPRVVPSFVSRCRFAPTPGGDRLAEALGGRVLLGAPRFCRFALYSVVFLLYGASAFSFLVLAACVSIHELFFDVALERVPWYSDTAMQSIAGSMCQGVNTCHDISVSD